MAKQRTPFSTGFEDHLDPAEISALQAEQNGEAPLGDPPPEPATPEPAPEPEPVATAPTPERYVPYDRFHAVNEESKQLRERLARIDERMNLAREAEQKFVEAQRQATTQATKPDPDLDPTGAELWERDQRIGALRAELEEMKRGLGQTHQTMQQQQQLTEYQQRLQNDVTSYRREKPDYDQAANHAFDRVTQFVNGTNLPEDQKRGTVNMLADLVARMAIASGRNVASEYYRWAELTGYQPQNGAPAAARPAATQSNAQNKLAQAKAGQRFQGLSTTSAERENGDFMSMNAAELAAFPEDDFLEAMSDPKKRRQFMARIQDMEGAEA